MALRHRAAAQTVYFVDALHIQLVLYNLERNEMR